MKTSAMNSSLSVKAPVVHTAGRWWRFLFMRADAVEMVFVWGSVKIETHIDPQSGSCDSLIRGTHGLKSPVVTLFVRALRQEILPTRCWRWQATRSFSSFVSLLSHDNSALHKIHLDRIHVFHFFVLDQLLVTARFILLHDRIRRLRFVHSPIP